MSVYDYHARDYSTSTEQAQEGKRNRKPVRSKLISVPLHDEKSKKAEQKLRSVRCERIGKL